MITPVEKQMLHAFVGGRVHDRDAVDFADEVAAVKRYLPGIATTVEGKDVSLALRAAGFNRRYNVAGHKRSDVIYGRTTK